jgi:hypothetical protein
MSDHSLKRAFDCGSASAAFTQRRLSTLDQAEVSWIACLHSSGVLLRRLCLVAAYVFLFFHSSLAFAPAYSQTDPECLSAASLWLPSASARLKVVTKWNKDIRFAILSREKNSATVRSIEADLKFLSQQTGLKFVEVDQSDETALPDLAIAVVPNINDDALRLREVALKYLQVKFREVHGRFTIDPDSWSRNLRSLTPKCTGLDIEVNGEKSSSFTIVQEDESPRCATVSLAETFGVIGARDRYVASDNDISEAVIGKALRGLYSEKIRAGMSRAEAFEKLTEACE